MDLDQAIPKEARVINGFNVGVLKNGLESEISRTFLDFLHLWHEFFVISGHGT